MSPTDLPLLLIKRDGEMLLASLTALYSSNPRAETQSISPFTRLIKLHTAATKKKKESVLFLRSHIPHFIFCIMSAAFFKMLWRVKRSSTFKNTSRDSCILLSYIQTVNPVDSVNDRKSRLSVILKYSEDKSVLIEISDSPKPQVDQMHWTYCCLQAVL